MKKEKGITLVALIITIIVLLILAVVTISAVNEGSLFAHSNNAAAAYSAAQEEENTMISNWLTELAKHDGTEKPLTFADVAGKYYVWENGEKQENSWVILTDTGDVTVYDPSSGITEEQSGTYTISGNIITETLDTISFTGGSINDVLIKNRYSEENGRKKLFQYFQSWSDNPSGVDMNVILMTD